MQKSILFIVSQLFSFIQVHLVEMLAYTVTITFGGMAWMVYLHDLEGIHEHAELSFPLHLLRDGSLALPLVFVAVCLGFGLMARLGGRLSPKARGVVLALVLGLTTAVAFAAGVPLHNALFPASGADVIVTHAHEVQASVQPVAQAEGGLLDILQDGKLAFPVNTGLALLVSLVLLFKAVLSEKFQGVFSPVSQWLNQPAIALNVLAEEKNSKSRSRKNLVRSIFSISVLAAILIAPIQGLFTSQAEAASSNAANISCRRIFANVVALDQTIVYNRYGVLDPEGMMYALREDVVERGTGLLESQGGKLAAGKVQLRSDKRPRPLTLRMNVGDCLSINFQNLLRTAPGTTQPATRSAGISVLGMQLRNSILDDGSNVGKNAEKMGSPLGGLVNPGDSTTYTFYAEHEGAFELYSPTDTVSTEALGVLSHGLFGVVNVEPTGAEWYRSQVSRDDMDLATPAESFVDTNQNKTWDKLSLAESFTDVNGNGVWDRAVLAELFTDANKNGTRDVAVAAEIFVDANANGKWDAIIPAEAFTDGNSNGSWDAHEVFVDANGNGSYDSAVLAEAFVDANANARWDAEVPGEIFTDANENGKWDDAIAAESFVDANGNEKWDAAVAAEDFQDLDGSGAWNTGEPFTDANGNSQWDAAVPAETYTDANSNNQWDAALAAETYTDANTNGKWDAPVPAETFTDDNHNNQWDDATLAEVFTDANNNAKWDADEAYTDANANGKFDAAVPAELFTDANGNSLWDDAVPAEDFMDVNHNGQWDAAIPAEALVDANKNGSWDGMVPAEIFTDSNGNGKWDAHVTTTDGHPIINYDAVYPDGHHLAGRPIFRMLTGNNQIIHTDLTAIITGPGRGRFVGSQPDGGWFPPNPTNPDRNRPFREFTIIFHDEIALQQAFPLFDDPELKFTLHGVRDGKGINYGTGGIAAEVIANRLGVGPAWDCPECKLEEFFLTSWALGDPSMIVDIPANTLGAEPFVDTNKNGTLDGPLPAEAFVDANNNGAWDQSIPAEVYVDTNKNNRWDAAQPAETYTDANANGKWDASIPAETFTDSNGNGVADPAALPEAFVDVNANGLWDDASPDEIYDDVNLNGSWDADEPFTDANGNNVYDYATPAETYTDANANGKWDNYQKAEVYVDANANGKWDATIPAESFVDTNKNASWDDAVAAEQYTDANRNGAYDAVTPAETFTDANGNGNWDPDMPAETYTDTNHNGSWDSQGVLVTGPKATKAFYPDDPSNVYHTYINDHTVFRNIHVGVEHHIFHLHSHQWLQTPNDDNSTYLDSMAIGPGASYTYEIAYGGSGNRNKTPGDAIFHCHFYPHFAQGMWAMWRSHDVFEWGTELDANGIPLPGSRALPDGEIAAGTAIPGVVPIPGQAMAPMPGGDTQIINGQVDADGNGIADFSEKFAIAPSVNPGYPFYIPGVAGHRPPTPPLDMTDPETGKVMDGGLPRHVITGGHAVAQTTPLDMTKVLESASAIFPAEAGTPAEQLAMQFHATLRHDTFTPEGLQVIGNKGFETNGLAAAPGAPFAEPCRNDDGTYNSAAPQRTYRGADIQLDMKLNKLGWHFPQARMLALWQDVGAFLSGARAPEPFVMRANSNDCINYYHTNLIPGVYEQDAYQVRTPTDIIGQHIHLVKFDVTASDGSANGFNYEDGTLSPDEVRERIAAIRAHNNCNIGAGGPHDTTCPIAEAHPYFGPGPNGAWIGARTTMQRWWADPVLNNQGQDRTLGNVYTHDHYGPSTHQQTGLYATLIIEPSASLWRDPETGICFGNTGLVNRGIPAGVVNGGCSPVSRTDGGPTSWRADILTADNAGIKTKNMDVESFREFYFEFSDFQHAYAAGRGAVFNTSRVNIGGQSYSLQIPTIIPEPLYAINPAGAIENNQVTKASPWLKVKPSLENQADECPTSPTMSFVATGCPESISTADVGTFSMNYRNEPVAARLLDPLNLSQVSGDAGDMSLVFSSTILRTDKRLNTQPTYYPALTADVAPGDPYTPLMRVYEADKVRVKVQVGATEEGHNASLWGTKWLQEFASPNSGWRNSQMMGISEQFNWDTITSVDPAQKGNASDYLFSPDNSADGIWNGVWSIMRSYSKYRTKTAGLGTDLLPLPNNRLDLKTNQVNTIANQAEFDKNTKYLCPLVAPKVTFNITAVLARDALPNGTLVYNSRKNNNGPLHDPTAILYVRSSDLDAAGKLKAGVPIEPLVLRARAGDCIKVTLTNKLPSIMPDLPGYNMLPPIIDRYTINPAGTKDSFNFNDLRTSNRVGLRPQLIAYETTRGAGNMIGKNSNNTAAPGATLSYWWYAGDLRYNSATSKIVATPIEFGATNLISSDLVKHSSKGLLGGLIIEPQNSVWVEDASNRASATVYRDANNNGKVDTGEVKLFRDFALIFQDDINMRFGLNGTLADGGAVPFIAGEDDAEDTGMKALNFRTEPLWYRLGIDPTAVEGTISSYDFSKVLSNRQINADPQTPIFQAKAGESIRLRVLQPGGHPRNHVFALHGHIWPRNPYASGCIITFNCIGSTQIGDNLLTTWIGSQEGLGPGNHWDFIPAHGAGGAFAIPGDYLFRDMAPKSFYNGSWGILRVNP